MCPPAQPNRLVADIDKFISYIYLFIVRQLLLGNEAIAYGALSAGVAVATGYPGTPSSEVIETLLEYRDRIVEWTTNEKVAVEIAYGAALSGARALAAMKHVGLNVAADPLHSAAYTGVEGALLIVVADDPAMWSSQNEQDTRWYGVQAYVPVLEPSDPQDAFQLAKEGFSLSESFGHPVLLRSVTRVSHVRAPVVVEPPAPPKFGRFQKRVDKHVLVPAIARTRKVDLLKKWESLADVSLRYTKVDGEGDLVVIASGVGYAYAAEALERYNVRARLIKIGMSVPISKRILDMVPQGEAVVVEEGDPVLEIQLRSLGLRTKGKLDGFFPRHGELTLRSVIEGISKAFNLGVKLPSAPRPPLEPPSRPAYLCPGCPHMGTFYALRIAAAGAKIVWSGDIGCYSLGVNLGEQDVLTHMGSSLGLGMGIAQADREKLVVATIGDSTFYHAALPQLVDLKTKRVPLLLVVMDNEYTAMTGGQPSPSRDAPAEIFAQALGIKYFVVDPADVKTSVEKIREAVSLAKSGEPAVVVSRRPCILEALRVARRAGFSPPRYVVDADKCKSCGICYNLLKCYAISKQPDGKAWIDPSLCNGCSMCAQVCPYNAIKPQEPGKVNRWLELWSQA
ncbi:indolepyruvate ferredoxin oxidoreductase, alpha subunit [Thermoproteus tenax Kra 1]|uniref:Indolepyruvate oxidoreductase subunit IorA n=2 Tax=Thermoproteus tenax TaxID=2271 RepID=G4RP74_THETK|nr:indolepyruvate ferredoxin oxidoreductase, alpha subunit [Thermoproteus tenax Kra 1]